MEFSVNKINCSSVQSLSWQADNLIDWVGGGTKYALDGSQQDSSIRFAYDFDAAVSNGSGDIAVIYQRLGTKGLIVNKEGVIREINRSYYQANVYEYPICFWEPNGRSPAIIHCPNEYNQLVIEDAFTGQSIVSNTDCEAPDFFHSRLSVCPSSKHLMSAGWVWHPMDVANIYTLPCSDSNVNLNIPFSTIETANEVSSASWISETSILAANSDDFEYDEGEPFLPGAMGIWSLESKQWSDISVPDTKLGLVVALDMQYAISFYEHPKLIRISDGAILQEWRHIYSGKQCSSIIHGIDDLPPIAFDHMNQRFAIGNEDCIYVVSLEKFS